MPGLLAAVLAFGIVQASDKGDLGDGSADSGVVLLGAILPFSGAEADIGEEYRRAIELALADANVPMQVIYEDSTGQPARAVEAFRRLASRGVQAVLTVQSWTSNAVYPLAAEQGIVQLALGSAVFYRQGPGLAARLTVDVADEARYLTGHLTEYRRVAVVQMDNDYGRGWTAQLRELFGDAIVAVVPYPLDENDFSGLVATVKAADPDLLVMLSTAEAAAILRELRAAGVDAQAAGPRPIERPEVRDEPAADGLLYSIPLYDVQHPFIPRYTELYGEPPTVFGAEGYDAVITLARAIADCGGSWDASCVHQWYVGRDYEGALGQVRFDESADAHYAFTLRQVRDGAFVSAEVD